MHVFDLSLKDLLMDGAPALLEQVAGVRSIGVLPVELPAVASGRLDLLGVIDGQAVFHTELQATNDDRMHIRMLGYHWFILRHLPRVQVRQVALYVGEAPMAMPDRLEGPMIRFTVDLVDVRRLDAGRLLASDAPGDIVMALFAGTDDIRDRVAAVVRRLVQRLGHDPDRLVDTLARLSLLAPLRKAGRHVQEEIDAMPIQIDLETHPFASKFFLKGRAEGQSEVLLRLLTKRFGELPAAITARVRAGTGTEIDHWADQLLTVERLDQVFD